MSILEVIVALKASIVIKQKHAKCISALDTRMLQVMEKRFPGCNAAIESFNSDITDLQRSVDLLNKIELGINKANKKRKLDKSVNLTTKSIDSTTDLDLAKIRQELDKVQNKNVLLKLKLKQSQQSQQSLQTDSQRETDARRESQ